MNKLCLVFLLLLMTNASANDYQLGPGDKIMVQVYQEPELNTETQIAQSGFVDLPLIGQVQLEGKNMIEAKRAIEEQYLQGYLVSPNITVMVREYRPFFIHGEVKMPGSYKYQAEINVEQAIALAGGLKDRASKSEWVIWRGYPKVTVNVTNESKILPGDVIKINKSFF